MNRSPARTRVGVDVGGTFTDIALQAACGQVTAKVLTTPEAPELGVQAAISEATEKAGIAAEEIDLLIHGTTLATNALIERTGARTALITTEGFRDSVEMALENRFEQYDISIDRPSPLVPRYLRWPVRERINYEGRVLVSLDEGSVCRLFPRLEEYEIEAVAVGLLHSYANSAHERRVGEMLNEAFPDLSITLSSAACPEIREYERQSTACANAYVQPRISGYLKRLSLGLRETGLHCPILLMTSGGGLTTLENAARFPVRLVESGPAGGAILSSEIARECDCGDAVSLDMGGTTAKISLIDGYRPQSTRTFEVARAYRNLKGSGLPVRIPAIEMVEIGAGGGSIASVDEMGRLHVGPASSGADPGPACYDRGGTSPTVTDADVMLGRIEPAGFAGGSVHLAPEQAERSILRQVGERLDIVDSALAAHSITEIVDENMANAARVHAIEWGKDISARAMIAFGGAAPLHACRLAQKLDIDRVIVPTGAGVGSAIGMLRAAISYEVVRSRHMLLGKFDVIVANALLAEMREEARAVVVSGAGNEAKLTETRHAYMRYVGQGHEIVVSLPLGALEGGDPEALGAEFNSEYARLYGRTIPGQEREIMSWTLTVTAPKPATTSIATGFNGSPPDTAPAVGTDGQPNWSVNQHLFDPLKAEFVEARVFRREELAPGAKVAGSAKIVEDQTTTIVLEGFLATVDKHGYLILERLEAPMRRNPATNGHGDA